jgi:hypothetical protein
MTDKRNQINLRVTDERLERIKKTGMTKSAYCEYAMDQLERNAGEQWMVKNPVRRDILLDEDTDAVVCKICDELNITVDQALSFMLKLCAYPAAITGVFAALDRVHDEARTA